LEVSLHRFKRQHIAALLAAALILVFTGLALDNRLQTTDYTVYDSRIPAAFEGYKIAQISDVHCQWFGEGQSGLIAAVQTGNPDIIVLTGDIYDARIQDYDCIAAIFGGLTKIAPVYAVSGNHENYSKSVHTRMNDLYEEFGVRFLDDSSAVIAKDGAEILIYGLDDRSDIPDIIPQASPDTYGILLFHRSNLFDILTTYGFGLVFSGHGHGGLIRLPFVGGIISPEGTLDFTQKYAGGFYTAGNTTLISNRGMSGSHSVPRIFNRPEIVFVTLHQIGMG
jgi:predicted MPP superfamily phosphohydrolase